MSKVIDIPEASYGVTQQDFFESTAQEIAEQVKRLGYAILDSGYTSQELEKISADFETTRKNYIQTYGKDYLRNLDEINTIRSPVTHGSSSFLTLVMNPHLLEVISLLIVGKFILNQQNGVINPPQNKYNQGYWHRDLPYQHYVSSSPLAVNALFCIDDFTLDNGSTHVLPASHKSSSFPSNEYIKKNSLQVEAKAGSYILLDCMLFHTGGFNRTDKERRAVNHVFTIPYFKQQINIPENIFLENLSDTEKEILGFGYQEPKAVKSYLEQRYAKS